MKKKTIFLACSIGEENSEVRKHSDTILTHLVNEAINRSDYLKNIGIEVNRADKMTMLGRITPQIINLLIEADVCVADLTGLNPNVLYELGIRQAMLRPYILLAQKGTVLPFDLQDSRTIFYDTTSLDSMLDARNVFESHLKEALAGTIDPFDRDLFGINKTTATSQSSPDDLKLRLMETLDGMIEAEHSTADSVEALSHRLSSAVNKIEELFVSGYRGAGTYLYINGEQEAFNALVAALSRAKDTIRTTRYSPFAVSSRQEEFANIICRRVLGDKQFSPVQHFYRIVAVNNISKIEDIKEYIRDFVGKPFTLFLTPYSNNFELVIIDDTEVLIHFHGRDKIIDSTLHIINKEVAKKFIEIYSSLIDPSLHEDIRKYDFKYILKQDSKKILDEVEKYFAIKLSSSLIT